MHARYPRTLFICLPALLLLTFTPSLLSAGVVLGFLGASGPGLESMSFNDLGTPSPGNDDFAGLSPNYLWVNQKAYNNVDYIDMVFAVRDSGGTTEYVLTEGVNNGTGIDWTDYHLELGFGTGASFVISPPGDGLDFDTPDMNSPYTFAPFTSITVTEDTIDCVGGIVEAGMFYNFTFPIDVPPGISEFTVRQWPTIEPVPTQEARWGEIKKRYAAP